MSFFNDAQIRGMKTGEYLCEECGSVMSFEDKWEEILVCPKCGYSVALDRYGFTEEEYTNHYPREEELEN